MITSPQPQGECVMGFVFYDTETTGTDTSFDQILQFAAIHTDPDLNELDRFEIRCRLLPGVVAAPGAMQVTGVRASQLSDQALPSHYEMMCRIREKLLEWSPSTFLGYNSIEFDEHLLRHSFFKTLHPPYLTNTNGNTRSDVMRMTQAASLFTADALEIPVGGNGKRSYKLEHIAPANGFSHENAHDALADVEATIHVCRLISERAPEVWSSFMRFGQKAAVIDYVLSETIFCYSDFYFAKPFSWMATVLGENPDNNSELYIFDLEVDPESLMALSDVKLVRRLDQKPKPVRRLRCNASPMIMPAEDAPDFVGAKTLGMDELERRALFLSEHEQLRDRLIQTFRSEREVSEPSPYVEKQLYGGFSSNADQQLMEVFHQVPWPERVAIVEQFEDLRLRELGFRLIHAEYPEALPEQIRSEIGSAQAQRLLDDGSGLPWMTLKNAEQELLERIADSTGEQREFYLEHLAFVTERTALAETCV